MNILGVIENPFGVVIGAVLENGESIMLSTDQQVPRAQLAQAARALAAEYGITLPDNPAIPPE